MIIVNAKKPAFFTHRLRHIREYRPEKKTLSWRQPEKLVPGKIYSRASRNNTNPKPMTDSRNPVSKIQLPSTWLIM